MLKHLRVTNFALLSDVAVEFESGLNVLTGETGAGKSLIVEAVNLLRGGRASADIPRTGEKEAVVEAQFEIADSLKEKVDEILHDAGVASEGPELVVRRIIHRGGRSRTYINGTLSTAKRLGQLGVLLVDLSGQHEHQGLVDSGTHRSILDSFAGNDLTKLSGLVAEWKKQREAFSVAKENSNLEAEKIEYMRYQIGEIDNANLIVGEEIELEESRGKLANVEFLSTTCQNLDSLLFSGESAAVDQLGKATKYLEKLTHHAPVLEEALKQCGEAQALVDEAARSVQSFASELEDDPEALRRVEERLDVLSQLKRRHASSIEEVIELADNLRAKLEKHDNRDAFLETLQNKMAEAEVAAMKVAKGVRQSRKKASKKLVSQVNRALHELGMEAAALEAKIEDSDLSEHGTEKVEFQLSSNLGEKAKPLGKIASGGELSRITLALKVVLRAADLVASYVFDEVDTGISGQTAEVVGRQIKAVSKEHQVICVTHLPQIAAYADSHFHVEKSETKGRTETIVRKLNKKDHLDEVARMLSGKAVTKAARANAKQLIAEAQAV